MITLGYKVTTVGAKSANTREILGDSFGVVYPSKGEAEIAADKLRKSSIDTWFCDLWFAVCRIERAVAAQGGAA